MISYFSKILFKYGFIFQRVGFEYFGFGLKSIRFRFEYFGFRMKYMGLDWILIFWVRIEVYQVRIWIFWVQIEVYQVGIGFEYFGFGLKSIAFDFEYFGFKIELYRDLAGPCSNPHRMFLLFLTKVFRFQSKEVSHSQLADDKGSIAALSQIKQPFYPLIIRFFVFKSRSSFNRWSFNF